REGIVAVLLSRLVSDCGIATPDQHVTGDAWRRIAGTGESAGDEASARKAGQALGVDAVVLGDAMELSGSTAQVTAILLRVSDGVPIRRISVTGSADSTERLVDRVSAALLAAATGEAPYR